MTHISKTIHFSLERFANRGVTKGESKGVIQKVFGANILDIKDSSFNSGSNWDIALWHSVSDEDIESDIELVEFHLDQIAREKEGRPTIRSTAEVAATIVIHALQKALGMEKEKKSDD